MKTPRGADELLLYLDYDGVLHRKRPPSTVIAPA